MMIKKIAKYISCFFLPLSLILLLSCTSSIKPPELQRLLGQEMWTCTNLRILENNCIYWQNYGYGKILPLGTSIRMVKGDSDIVHFVDNKGTEYSLHWRKDAKSQWKEEMPKYFSKDNLQEKLESMEETWKSLVFSGSIQKGMPGDMVLLSRGYPVLPVDYEKEDIWVYHENQNKKCLVYFENNLVVQVVTLP